MKHLIWAMQATFWVLIVFGLGLAIGLQRWGYAVALLFVSGMVWEWTREREREEQQ